MHNRHCLGYIFCLRYGAYGNGEKRGDKMDKWLRYEQEKKKLQAMNLDPKDYEEAIKKLTRKLKI